MNKVIPWRNGSVFDAFNLMLSTVGEAGSSTPTSPHARWTKLESFGTVQGRGPKVKWKLDHTHFITPTNYFFWFLSEYFNLLHTRKKLHSLTTIKN